MLNEDERAYDVGSLVFLSQMFDLSSSAMKGTLNVLAETSELVKEVSVVDSRIEWVLDINGRILREADCRRLSASMQSLILFELAGVHARHHARVEPTFLMIDGTLDFRSPRAQIAGLERLQGDCWQEHVQIA